MKISLPKLLNQAWGLLEEGQADGQSPFRLMSLATVDREGQPQARHVVLRGVDRAGENLEFHTDIGSSKCAELQANPQAQLLFWDPERAIQLRLHARIAMRNGKTYPEPVKLLMAKPRAPALRSVTPLPMRSLRRNRSLWFAVVRFKSLRSFRSKSNISGRCFKLTTAGPEHGFRPNVIG